MKFYDFRSDTVTLPTPEMRRAMAEAEVGDDVYREDPTVNLLQATAAKLLGKEAGLFVPSGTMGNLASILAHCTRGDEVILGSKSHTFLFEAGGISALGGVHSCQVSNQPDGSMKLEDIQAAIRSDDIHDPITRLISLENTHNRCGGVTLDVKYLRQVASLARANGIKMHLDGARLFNAAVALGVSGCDLAEPFDSVTICLSKGLCAPVGSVIVGSEEFIRSALRIRKQLGGGMRQAGIIAAAGLIALEKMVDRLVEDHRRAQNLAAGFAKIPGLRLEPKKPDTNMVFVSLEENVPLNAQQVVERLQSRGIKTGAVAARQMRFVTHYWIDDEAVDQAVAAFMEIL